VSRALRLSSERTSRVLPAEEKYAAFSAVRRCAARVSLCWWDGLLFGRTQLLDRGPAQGKAIVGQVLLFGGSGPLRRSQDDLSGASMLSEPDIQCGEHAFKGRALDPR